jgi:hypothetical protein
MQLELKLRQWSIISTELSYKRNQVIEITDMANSMQLISRKVFLKQNK